MATPPIEEPLEADPPVSMDDDGDLILRVGGADGSTKPEKIVEFKVDSNALRRASPFFKSLLFGPWRESKPASESEPWIVALPDDEPVPFTILMGLAHARNQFLPKHWKTITIKGILVLADKYDMVHLLSPHVAVLRSSLASNKASEPCFQVLLDLAIAWELGEEDIFARALKIIILSSGLTQDTNQLMFEGKILASLLHLGPISENLLQYIAETRTLILGDMCGLLNRLFTTFRTGHVCRQNLHFRDQAAARVGRELCDASIGGGLAQWGHRSGKRDLPELPVNADSESIVLSCNGFYNLVVAGLKKVTLLRNHEECSPLPKFIMDAKIILNGNTSERRFDTENLLSKEQREVMQKKRKRFDI